MRASKSRKISLCGVMGALCLTVMLLGGIIPCATFCAPAISGMLIFLVSLECGARYGVLLYLAVSTLALMLVPEIEMSLIFTVLLGYYPLLCRLFGGIGPGFLRWAAKLVYFNAVISAMYGLLRLLMPVLVQDVFASGRFYLILLLLLGNVTFILYDMALASLGRVYMFRIHPHIAKHKGSNAKMH